MSIGNSTYLEIEPTDTLDGVSVDCFFDVVSIESAETKLYIEISKQAALDIADMIIERYRPIS